jgi:hypothetical protein
MTQAIDHTALPFDEIIEQRMFPRDLPTEGGIVCRIMQDGWEIGTWIEADQVGAGPVANKILAVNDLLLACKAVAFLADQCVIDNHVPAPRDAIRQVKAAIAKAEGRAT